MSSKGIVNFYALLEVGEDAEDDDIKKSYRRLVLKWHPDKNPSDRDKAEEQIRLINTAYATLSNPTKREKYDLQRCAVNNKNKGMAPRKPKVSPKISLPKEFMLQPLGHPEKFLRYSGKKTAVVGRQDVEVKFKEFFETAKFSLWWVPEVNNMCRVRALGSKADGDRRGAGAGLAGGLNLSFRTAANTESEVILGAARKGKRSENVDFIIKESPEYDGAYRFETGCRRGHYLAFVPPAELRVVPLLSEEEGRVLDFMLVDFSASIKFKDLNEVLQLLAEPKRGTWMPVSELRDSKEVASYFKKVMKLTEVWAAEDFAAYFEGHWVDWDYKAASNEVRLRPLDERLGEVLRSSHLADDVSVAVLTAGEELSKTPLAGILRAIHVLADAKKEAAKKGKSQEEGDVERMKLLKMMPDALLEAQKGIEEETDVVIGQVTPKDLIHGAERVPELLCEPILPNTLAHRKEAVKLLLELVITRLQKNETLDAKPKALSFEELMRFLRIQGAPTQDEALSHFCAPSLESSETKEVLQVVQRASAVGCTKMAEVGGSILLSRLSSALADDVAEAVIALAEAGSPPEPLAAALASRALPSSTPLLAAATATLTNKGASPGSLKPILDHLAQPSSLPAIKETMEAWVFIGLALLSGKVSEDGNASSSAAAANQKAFPAVCHAAIATSFKGWTSSELSRFLLCMVKGKDFIVNEQRQSLLDGITQALAPQIGDLPSMDFVKLVMAVSGFGPSQLLLAVVREAVVRVGDFSTPHLLLVTQGLARALPAEDPSLRQILEYWSTKLQTFSLSQTPGKEFSAEQVAKLLIALAPALKAMDATPGRKSFVEAACNHLLAMKIEDVMELPEASRTAMWELVEAGGVLASYSRQGDLLTALARRAKRLRSPSPGAIHEGHLKSSKSKKKKGKR